jgi:hypothetical protein
LNRFAYFVQQGTTKLVRQTNLNGFSGTDFNLDALPEELAARHELATTDEERFAQDIANTNVHTVGGAEYVKSSLDLIGTMLKLPPKVQQGVSSFIDSGAYTKALSKLQAACEFLLGVNLVRAKQNALAVHGGNTDAKDQLPRKEAIAFYMEDPGGNTSVHLLELYEVESLVTESKKAGQGSGWTTRIRDDLLEVLKHQNTQETALAAELEKWKLRFQDVCRKPAVSGKATFVAGSTAGKLMEALQNSLWFAEDKVGSNVEQFTKGMLSMYPQSNVIGSDLPNEKTALALLTINEHTMGYFLAQSAARLRGLAAGKRDGDTKDPFQRIHYLLSPPIAAAIPKAKQADILPSVQDIITFAKNKQQNVERQNNYFAKIMLVQHEQKYLLQKRLADIVIGRKKTVSSAEIEAIKKSEDTAAQTAADSGLLEVGGPLTTDLDKPYYPFRDGISDKGFAEGMDFFLTHRKVFVADKGSPASGSGHESDVGSLQVYDRFKAVKSKVDADGQLLKIVDSIAKYVRNAANLDAAEKDYFENEFVKNFQEAVPDKVKNGKIQKEVLLAPKWALRNLERI